MNNFHPKRLLTLQQEVSQYYRWSVLQGEINDINALLLKRATFVGGIKEEINMLSIDGDSKAGLLPGETLGQALHEEQLIKEELESQKNRINK